MSDLCLQAVATMQWTTASMSSTRMSQGWRRSRPRNPQHSGELPPAQHTAILPLSCTWHPYQHRAVMLRCFLEAKVISHSSIFASAQSPVDTHLPHGLI
jgi:hypothetical protein